MTTLAAIDIGTHSVLLLIAQKDSSGKVKPLVEEATLTRIGEGMSSNKIFLPAGMERTLNVLKKYRKICEDHHVETILAVGTAAFRKAQNTDLFLEEVAKECGIPIQIISGEREAALTWEAATTDFGPDIAVVDIGGGSTEIIADGVGRSLPIGSVLLTEKYGHSDPISKEDYRKICHAIEEKVKYLPPPHPSPKVGKGGGGGLIAIAGTATTLAAIKMKMKVYKHHEVHGSKLTLKELKNIIEDLKSKTIEERKKIPGLEPGRADVILAGSLLLKKIVEHLGIQEITVSDRGVRWGLAYEFFSSFTSPLQKC